jgi:hypothetical protein
MVQNCEYLEIKLRNTTIFELMKEVYNLGNIIACLILSFQFIRTAFEK